MAELIRGSNIASIWSQLGTRLLYSGKESAPRKLRTKEILNMSIHCSDLLNNILISPSRNLNFKFMVAEWLWIMGGFDEVEMLATYNSVMKEYSDDGAILNGAYGPRLMPQIPYILNNLAYSDSRQAVATIWTPSPKPSKDIPCTISIQFLIRDDKLHCTVNMRSSDFWLGLPYDFFNFSQIANTVAAMMLVEPASITMNLASSHLYEQDWEKTAGAIKEYEDAKTPLFLKSPKIGSDWVPPQPWIIKRMLKREINRVLPHPWNHYSEALSAHTKKDALEVLNDLSTV